MNSRVSLDTREGTLSCMNTELTVRLELVICEERLVYKIAIVSTVQFNFADFEWSNNGLVDAFST